MSSKAAAVNTLHDMMTIPRQIVDRLDNYEKTICKYNRLIYLTEMNNDSNKSCTL